MTRGAVPPPAAVRRGVLLVVAAYALPLLATGSLLAWVGILGDWRLLALFAAFLAAGAAGRLACHLRGRLQGRRLARRRGRPPPPVDDATRAAILAHAPELGGLDMVVGGAGGTLKINGRRLLVGAAWMGPERPGTEASDERFFAVAHEARHWAVNAFGLLRYFRVIKAAQVSAVGTAYTSVMVNVAFTLDDPDRVSLTVAAVLLPYVAGTLRAVLDEATNALEWRLELDANATAVERCRAAGRLKAIPLAERLVTLLDRADMHGPPALHARVLAGASVRRSTMAVLVTGWVAMTVPLASGVLAGLVTVDNPDMANAALGLVLLVSLLAAGVSVVAAAQAGMPGGGRLVSGACALWLRVHSVAMRLLAWAMSTLAVPLACGSAVTAIHGGLPQSWDVVMALSAAAAAVTYVKAASNRPRTGWLVANALMDGARLWVMVWLLRASGVLPFYDDVDALGAVLREDPGIIGREMGRMWLGEHGWLAGAAVGCLLASGAVAVLVIHARAVLDAKVGAPVIARAQAQIS